MKKAATRWTSRLIKLAVCGAALVYLSSKVTLEDYARLASDPQTKHIILSEKRGPDGMRLLTIRDATTGDERTVHESQLADQERLREIAKDYRPIEKGLKSVVFDADWRWTSASLIAFAPVTFIIAWRLRVLLLTQDIRLSYRDALLLTFAGNFFNFAMPGTTGGDIYKAYHIAKKTHKRTEGITVVILDRVFGLVSFLLIAVVAIFVARKTLEIGGYGTSVGFVMLAFVVCGMMYFSRRARRAIGFERLIARLPLADKLRRIDETAFSLRHHRRQTVLSLIVTIVSHFIIVLSIYFLARGLGIHPNLGRSASELFTAVLIATVVGYLFAAVPISIQGFGLLEAVFIRVLVQGQWCDNSTMLALTLGMRLVQIVWSLPGIVVPWLGLERPPESAVEAELGDTPAELMPERSSQIM